MTQDPIERCLHPVCSALVEVLPHAMDTPISAGGVVSIDGKYLSFEAGRALAKSLGFRSYIDLLFWLSENYGVPFKGLVTWPNTESCHLRGKETQPEK